MGMGVKWDTSWEKRRRVDEEERRKGNVNKQCLGRASGWIGRSRGLWLLACLLQECIHSASL